METVMLFELYLKPLLWKFDRLNELYQLQTQAHPNIESTESDSESNYEYYIIRKVKI
jgi:hypothetical protein